MFLAKEFVLKKLNSALKKSLSKVQGQLTEAKKELKQNPDSNWTKKRIKRLENQLKGFNSLDGIPWKPRKGTFEGNTSYGGGWYSQKHSGTVSHGLDIETGRAHSYEWYDLGKIIRGTYVVNSYRYSCETGGHYYSLIKTLKILGVRFVELEAPKGLQDLESGRTLQLERIAEATISIKYGQKESSKWRLRNIKDAEKELAKLSQFGIKTTQKMKADAIEAAEKSREIRLVEAKQDRERSFVRCFERAMRSNDLKEIVKYVAQDKKRVARGLPSLIKTIEVKNETV